MVETADGCWKKTSSFGFLCRHWWMVVVINLHISASIRVSPIIPIMTFRWQKLTNKPSACVERHCRCHLVRRSLCVVLGCHQRNQAEKMWPQQSQPAQTHEVTADVQQLLSRRFGQGTVSACQHVAVRQRCGMQIRQRCSCLAPLHDWGVKKVKRKWSRYLYPVTDWRKFLSS